MARLIWLFGLAFFLAPHSVSAQPQSETPPPQLGLKLGAVPDVVYAQVPELSKQKGILIEDVAADSPAFRGGLRRHDIILQLAGKPVDDVKTLQEALAKLEPGDIVQLTLMRSGLQKGLPFTLTRPDETGLNAYTLPKGFLKPGSPPAVSIQAQPMEKGVYNVTILYYREKSGKLERLNFVGPIAEIESQFQSEARTRGLSDSVVDLTQAALRRLRTVAKDQDRK